MIKVSNLTLNPKFSSIDIINEISKNLKVAKNEILDYIIIRKSVDARRKPKVFYILTLGVNLKDESRFNNLKFEPDFCGINYKHLKLNLAEKPVVVGFGPCGMFAALVLSQMGLEPIIVEQGADVDTRSDQVETFWQKGILNPNSNVQFGEGGAGTFSDGKLNTNLNNEYCQKIINQFYLYGAPKDILYDAKPHIGSDKLKFVVKNLRNDIIKNGGTVLFNTKLIDINISSGQVEKIIVKDVLTNVESVIKTKTLVLAIGHSARDTFRLLKTKNVFMQPKPFAMGVRIEQPQELINASQYGASAHKMPSADYKLVTHLSNGRSVFTFCMCPGGMVVNSASEVGTVVTNGMSNFGRDSRNANSAVLVNVLTSDYETSDVLAGLDFQAKYEKLAYKFGGENYNCPAQSVGEFLTGKTCEIKLIPSLKITYTNLKAVLPNFVYESLKLALPVLDNKLKGFADSGNLLIGVETRSSSPVTIVRDNDYKSNIAGLYPAGEGAGYAGGIISSAIDGVKVALQIFENNKL